MSKKTKPFKSKHFARMLQEWRERKGYSQRDAAEALEISIKSLQNWEQKRATPRGYALKMLVKMIAPAQQKR